MNKFLTKKVSITRGFIILLLVTDILFGAVFLYRHYVIAESEKLMITTGIPYSMQGNR